MNEDALFREVLSCPVGSAHRLVYADCLEDQGDPRAAYLRAEVVWSENRNRTTEKQARALSVGLDPVWVARVSRPPLGVCCDRVRFSHSGPERTAADLDQVEHRLGARLPPDYHAFLLNYNGGVPDPACILDPRHEPPAPQCLFIQTFNTSWEGKEEDIEDESRFVRSIHEMYPNGTPYLAEGMLPVAHTLHDLGMLLVGLTAATFGKVFHFTNWARSMDNPDALAELAPNFADLLARLTNDLED